MSYCNLPGFCGLEEPEVDAFKLHDFALYFHEWNERCGTLPIHLGFSFGGAVALYDKARFWSFARLVLVSPAIKRRETIKSLS